MKISTYLGVVALSIFGLPIQAWSATASPDILLANEIQTGCTLRVAKYNIQPINNQKYDLILNWQCSNNEQTVLDTYLSSDTQSHPEIVTVFYTKSHDVIVLVKWDETFSGAKATHYKLFAYRYVGDISDALFVKMDRLSRQFGEGYDGILNGQRIDYQYKTAAAIRKHLTELGE